MLGQIFLFIIRCFHSDVDLVHLKSPFMLCTSLKLLQPVRVCVAALIENLLTWIDLFLNTVDFYLVKCLHLSLKSSFTIYGQSKKRTLSCKVFGWIRCQADIFDTVRVLFLLGLVSIFSPGVVVIGGRPRCVFASWSLADSLSYTVHRAMGSEYIQGDDVTGRMSSTLCKDFHCFHSQWGHWLSTC